MVAVWASLGATLRCFNADMSSLTRGVAVGGARTVRKSKTAASRLQRMSATERSRLCGMVIVIDH